MRLFSLFVCIAISLHGAAQQNPEAAIRKVLAVQQDAWNQGNIQDFMKGYWKSDSLMFIGGNGITYGFENTWERYKKSYNSREKMGTLQFNLLHFVTLGPDAYMVVGKWNLTRTVGNIGGHFTLIFKQIGGEWLIISDHTSEARP